MERETIGTIASRLLGRNVTAVHPVGHGGRNSLVFVLHSADGTKFIAKKYHGLTQDGRDRLQSEYSALQWLVHNGETRVPRPIASDSGASVAVYEFIDGGRIVPADVTEQDVDEAVSFLLGLNRLRAAPGAEELPCAAEACFTLSEVVANISMRLSVLAGSDESSPARLGLHSFLFEEFSPYFERRLKSVPDLLAGDEWWKTPISGAERVLSPSDFGFHNAIRRADNTLAFVDFEYFGWDDPAKMVVDFLLHPGMDLAPELQSRFCVKICSALPYTEKLAARLPVAYTLFGLKWCLILLNEYVAGHRARRRFAGEASEDEELLCGQLAKAKAMLEKVRRGYPHY